MSSIDPVLHHIDAHVDDSLERLFALLRFPSISTDPAYREECRKTAGWIKAQLEELGIPASIRETTGQPVIVGKYAPAGLPSHAPHILFYGHYDVQPAVPLNLWDSPPFEPQIRAGKGGVKSIFARGSSDDKGQFMTFLEASRAWLAVHERLPFRLTVLIEGDEEGDNMHLDRFVTENRKELKADVAFVCDTGMWDAETPAIVTRLRGCIGEEITITGPSKDLHSGYYGGAARNPIRVLTKILADLHDKSGRIAIPGFYDDVEDVPKATRKQWDELKFPAKKFLENVGLSVPAGEARFSVHEQIWARPTAEINGIWGGYTGEGRKTVLPSTATAKLTFRLVDRQDPLRIRKQLHAFVKQRLPKDCTASFDTGGGDNVACVIPETGPWVQLASRALAAEWGKTPVCIAEGGSIPVVSTFKDILGIPSLLTGTSRENDAFHSPNEKYDVESYHRGMRGWARIIAAVADQGVQS